MSAFTEDHARAQDCQDPLSHLRDQFIIPSKPDLARTTLAVSAQSPDDPDPSVYLCGNSLGLQPRLTHQYFSQYLQTWASKAVYGHFKPISDSALAPWLHVDDDCVPEMAKIVGGLESEVVVMQTLTANLHLMMASFYRPTKERWRVVLEGKAFPSDHVSRALVTGEREVDTDEFDSTQLSRTFDITILTRKMRWCGSSRSRRIRIS